MIVAQFYCYRSNSLPPVIRPICYSVTLCIYFTITLYIKLIWNVRSLLQYQNLVKLCSSSAWFFSEQCYTQTCRNTVAMPYVRFGY
jgi:hypothetical protein